MHKEKKSTRIVVLCIAAKLQLFRSWSFGCASVWVWLCVCGVSTSQVSPPREIQRSKATIWRKNLFFVTSRGAHICAAVSVYACMVFICAWLGRSGVGYEYDRWKITCLFMLAAQPKHPMTINYQIKFCITWPGGLFRTLFFFFYSSFSLSFPLYFFGLFWVWRGHCL